MPTLAPHRNEARQQMRLGPELRRASIAQLDAGLAAAGREQYAEALTAFDRALSLDPRNPRAWYNKGLALVALQRPADASTAFEHALELAPRQAFIWTQQGLVLAALGRDGEAIAAFEHALTLDPTDALAWHSKAAALARIHRLGEARAAYERTLTLEADHTVVWRGKGRAIPVEVAPDQLRVAMAAPPAPAAAPAAPPAAARPGQAPQAVPIPIAIPERPRLAPDVALLGAMRGTGFQQQQWLAQRGDRFIQLTELLYRVAEQADGQHTLEEIAAAVASATGRNVSAGNVRHLLATRLLPTGIIQASGGAPTPTGLPAGAPGAAPSPLALQLRVAALGPAGINRIAGPLDVLYTPLIVLVALPIFAASQWWVLRVHGVGGGLGEVFANPLLFLPLIALVLLATAAHEFGHAAALHYGGGRARSMGFGFYFGLPAFYTDVSENYRLGRWARVRTDLGGFYFNLLADLVLLGAYALTGQEFLLIVIWLTDIEILYNLVPFGRYDGYWILADMTGVPDFFSLIGPFLRSVVPFGGRGKRPLPALKRWVKIVLGVYTFVTVPLLIVSLGLLILRIPSLITTAWVTGKIEGSVLIAAAQHGDTTAIVVALVHLLSLGLTLLSAVIVLSSVGRLVARPLVARLRRPRQQPAPVVPVATRSA